MTLNYDARYFILRKKKKRKVTENVSLKSNSIYISLVHDKRMSEKFYFSSYIPVKHLLLMINLY